MTKNVLFGSLAIAIAMLVACIADIFTDVPFGGNLTPDIIFMIAAAGVTWMGIDCLKGMRKNK